jgi:hypothetical protein
MTSVKETFELFEDFLRQVPEEIVVRQRISKEQLFLLFLAWRIEVNADALIAGQS